MPLDTTSSGDLIADRRYDYALGLAQGGDLAAAAEVLSQALERAPAWGAGWLTLGDWREKIGRTDEAAAAYGRAAALDPDDALGARLRLAALRGQAPQAMPAAYVRTLFDDYAPRFEAALLGRLAYGTPDLIRAALPGEARLRTVIDLGCGTGLMGAAIRNRAGHLTGVDLSEEMLKRAATKGIYDRLVAAEALAFLAGEGESSADLIVAADVVPYFGGLAPLFGAVRRVLSPDGLFAFSTESAAGGDFVLRATLRYAHEPAYVQRAAEEAGLALLSMTPAALRREAGMPVEGMITVLERAAEWRGVKGVGCPSTRHAASRGNQAA